MIIIYLVFNAVFFLLYLKDMRERNSKIIFWFLIILVSGPIGITFYLSSRNLKDTEERTGGKLYNLAKNFMKPWTLYALVLPVISLALATFNDLFILGTNVPTGEFIGEMMFWTIGIMVFGIIPVFLVIPFIISRIIMSVSKPRSNNEKMG